MNMQYITTSHVITSKVADFTYRIIGYTIARTIQYHQWWSQGGEKQIKDSLTSVVSGSVMFLVTVSVAIYLAVFYAGYYTKKYWPLIKRVINTAVYTVEQSLSLDGIYCPCWGKTPDWSDSKSFSS